MHSRSECCLVNDRVNGQGTAIGRVPLFVFTVAFEPVLIFSPERLKVKGDGLGTVNVRVSRNDKAVGLTSILGRGQFF